MRDANSELVDRIHRTPWQLARLVLARPSVWLIWIVGAFGGALLFAVVLPRWIATLGYPLLALGVITPLSVRRMRVLDARAMAEGRLTVPDPRLLPPSVLDPAPAQLLATVDDALRRLTRSCRFNVVLFLVFAAFSVAAAVFLRDADTDIPQWIFAPMAGLAAVRSCRWALATIPRFLAAARETRDGFVAGAVPQQVGRVMRMSGFHPVVEITDSETRYETHCEWSSPRGVRANDEVLLVGNWRQGAVVLVTGTGRKGRPKSYWGTLKSAD